MIYELGKIKDMKYKNLHESSNYLYRTILLLSIGMCCAILGCSNDKVTDVSENNLLWGGYNPKSSYKTKIDIFLVTDTHFKGFEVSPEKKSSYWKGANVPDSIEEYHKATSSLKYRHVKGVVTAETIIRPEVLERHVGAGFVAKYDILYPYARILSGPFKGMLVKIFWISKYNCNKDETPYPHPEILTEISADNNRKKIPNTPLEPSR